MIGHAPAFILIDSDPTDVSSSKDKSPPLNSLSIFLQDAVTIPRNSQKLPA